MDLGAMYPSGMRAGKVPDHSAVPPRLPGVTVARIRTASLSVVNGSSAARYRSRDSGQNPPSTPA